MRKHAHSFLVTVISTLILNFHEAVLLGAMLGILLFLFQASQISLFRYRLEDQQMIRIEETEQPQQMMIQGVGQFVFCRGASITGPP